MAHLVVFGLGYSATAIGAALLKSGWTVSGTARLQEKFPEIEKAGFKPLLFSSRETVEAALRTATHSLVSVPAGEGGDRVLHHYRNALDVAPKLRWVGYLSTIGVYGDLQGAWADEETPAVPGTARGEARLRAEQDWSAFCDGRALPLDIFRLSGIYGPGRSPLDRVLAGDAQRVVKTGQVFNRIHVDDIAQTVLAAIHQNRRDAGTGLYNVADNEPAPPQDVLLYAAQLVGATLPSEIPFERATLSPMAQSFYAGNKRIDNGKIKQELGVRLKYPTYREGLQALAELPERS